MHETGEGNSALPHNLQARNMMQIFVAKIWQADPPYSPDLIAEEFFSTNEKAVAWLKDRNLVLAADCEGLWVNLTNYDITGYIIQVSVS